MQWSYLRFFLLIIFFLSNCEKASEQTFELAGKEWKLHKYQSSDGSAGVYEVIPESGEEYWIIFDTDDQVSIKDACNSCSGSYESQDDNSIVFSQVSCTEMACNGPSHFQLLEGLYTYSFNSDTLILQEQHAYEGRVYYLVEN